MGKVVRIFCGEAGWRVGMCVERLSHLSKYLNGYRVVMLCAGLTGCLSRLIVSFVLPSQVSKQVDR